MIKKTIFAAGMAIALGSGQALAAVGDPTTPIGIDWDGAGGFDTVGSLDWAVGSSWADDSVNIGTWEDTSGNTYTSAEANAFIFANPGTTLTCVSGCTFDLRTHAALSGYLDDFGNPKSISGLNSSFEWTFISEVNEDAGTQSATITDTGTDINGHNILTASAILTFDMSAAGNTAAEGFFFEIYYDTAVNADGLTGQGYDDGQLILSSTDLTFIDGDFTAKAFNFEDVNSDGNFDVGIDKMLTGANDPWLNMDSFGTNNWADGSTAGGTPECDTTANAGTDGNCLSVQGTGATQLEALVDQTTLDGNFFDPANFPLFFISDLVFSTQNVDPFLQTNPSGCYDTAAGSGSGDDNCSGYVFGSIVNPDGSISTDVVNGSSSAANCAFAAVPATCLAAVTAGQDVMFQTDANQGFRTTTVSTPEPGMIALLGMGLGLLGLGRLRRQRG